MHEAYAQALWKMIDSGRGAKKAVTALHEMLVRRGRQVLLPRIAHAFARIAMREKSRRGMVLTVANEKDGRHAHVAAKKALVERHIEYTSDIETNVDKTLIGGWRLEGNGHLIDSSYKKQLLTLYNRSTVE